jgi:hypothetical protein
MSRMGLCCARVRASPDLRPKSSRTAEFLRCETLPYPAEPSKRRSQEIPGTAPRGSHGQPIEAGLRGMASEGEGESITSARFYKENVSASLDGLV